MKNEKQAIIYMHIATFLFGMTAILGKLISLNEFNMVWYRMLLASLIFMLIPQFWKQIKMTSKKTIFIYLLNGIIVALHWISFYGSIKINDSASLTLACFGSVSIFAALMEPLILKTRLKKTEVLLGVIVLFGLFFIAKANPESNFSLESNYIKAILLALVSAFLAVLFTIINKKYIADNSPMVITWAQMLGGFVFMSLIMPFIVSKGVSFTLFPSSLDVFWLLLLAIICTNIAFSIEMEALKSISAFTSSIILNLEPIYGITAAIIIFKENETLNAWFYIGTIIVITSVFVHAYLTREKKSKVIHLAS